MWDTLIDILLYIPRQIWSWFIDALIALINSISLPAELNLSFDSFNSQWLYYLDVFQVDYGLTVIFGALTARFILRRIPLIG